MTNSKEMVKSNKKSNFSKNKSFFQLALFCFILLGSFWFFGIGRASAAIIYIDPTCQNSGDGTTMTCGTHGPLKTWAEVTWAAGNTYSQKGGTTAYETITPATSGTSGNAIIINSYGTGNANLDGSVTVSSGGWTADNPVAGTYKMASVSKYMWYEDNVPMPYGASNMLAGGQVAWDTYNYYKPSSGLPSDHTVQYTRLLGVDLASLSYITINGLSFTRYATGIGNAYGSSVTSGVSNSYITIANCSFDDTSWGVNILNNNATSSAINISNNTFSYNQNSIEFGSAGTGYHTGSTIANNNIIYCSQKKNTADIWRLKSGLHYILWGNGGDTEGIGIQNLNSSNVYGNSINGMCRGIVHYVISPSNGNDNNFYKNYVDVDQIALELQPESGATFIGNKVYYNVLIGGELDATYSEGYQVAMQVDSHSNNGEGTNYIYNNTIKSTGYVGVGAFSGLWNYNIKNNIIYGSNLSLLQWLFYMDSNSSVVLDRNLYYPVNNSIKGTSQWYYGSSNKTFAEWQLAGFDMSPTPTPADPLFTSESSYSLQAASSAINAGVDVGLTTDIMGNQIQGLPDIGAYEYASVTADTTPPAVPSGLAVQ